MDIIGLADLETQIDHLVKTLNRCKKDNQSLRRELALHSSEHFKLRQKTQAATKKIRQLMNELKETVS